jgi:hypothetical protein
MSDKKLKIKVIIKNTNPINRHTTTGQWGIFIIQVALPYLKVLKIYKKNLQVMTARTKMVSTFIKY